MSGRMNGPSTWRKTAYRAAMDIAEGRVSLDPEELMAFMDAHPDAINVIGGQPELDDDCPICRRLREQGGPTSVTPMPDGSLVEIYDPNQARRSRS